MAMTIDGETVYVPRHKRELINGLQKMGIFKIAGRPLERMAVTELQRKYCSERAAKIRREHRCGQNRQMSLFAAL